MTLSSPLKTVSQSNGVLYKPDYGREVLVQADGDDIFLTAIVTIYGETKPKVDLAGSGEPVSGVITTAMLPRIINLDKDSDDPYDDEDYLGMHVPKSSEQLYLTAKTNSTIAQGNWFKADGGFIVASAKADALGRVIDGVTAVSGTEKITLCEWGVDA